MKFDIYEQVTERIIKQLEKGIIPWKKPWKVSGVAIKGEQDLRKVAFNRITKTAYSPLNQMLLEKAGEYASFKQWQDLGGKIKKGAKAEIVVFWKMYEIIEPDKEKPEEMKRKQIPILKHLQVFHIDDVENVKPLNIEEIKDIKEFDPIQEAESIIDNYKEREKIKILYDGNDAFYSPSSDYIQLPERFKFGTKTSEFYSVAFHEITHSTGAKFRLDRLETTHFGSLSYSREELVAEIGACGMLNLLNIETNSSFTNSVAYIQSWIANLKKDPKLIVTASSKAEKAIKYILGELQEAV